jgi:hypothetical protein
VTQLRTKHPTFEAAAGELARQLPNLTGAHPNLSPQKAANALRQLFTGSGGDDMDNLIADAMREDVPPAAGGGRGANPSMPSPGGDPARTVTLAELQALANARGTSVEQEKARATAAGFIVR